MGTLGRKGRPDTTFHDTPMDSSKLGADVELGADVKKTGEKSGCTGKRVVAGVA